MNSVLAPASLESSARGARRRAPAVVVASAVPGARRAVGDSPGRVISLLGPSDRMMII